MPKSETCAGWPRTVCSGHICKLQNRLRVDAVQRQACFPPPSQSSCASPPGRGGKAWEGARPTLRVPVRNEGSEAHPLPSVWLSQLPNARWPASVATLSRKVVSSDAGSRSKMHGQTRISSGTTTGSCVITVNCGQKRRFAPNPSHHLTCCMRERFASTDICLLGSLVRRVDGGRTDFECSRPLHELGVPILRDPGERAPVVSSCKQKFCARCLQL